MFVPKLGYLYKLLLWGQKYKMLSIFQNKIKILTQNHFVLT